jgi:CheY-like chemotaxis protein
VLIVDDEPAITNVMALVVEQRGCVPLVAADGQEALELAHAQHPDLVITDLMMPRLDGAGLLAELRAEARADGRGPIPVILMTGARAAVVANVPADAVLVKPFHVEALLALLDRFLGPRASR